MKVQRRKVGESIDIGEDLVFEVAEVRPLEGIVARLRDRKGQLLRRFGMPLGKEIPLAEGVMVKLVDLSVRAAVVGVEAPGLRIELTEKRGAAA